MTENWKKLGLKKEEYRKIVSLHGKEPNFLELSMFAVMWSEHCSYKHSRETLKLFPTESSRVIQGPGENAGVVDIGDGKAVAFKIESHNHPSAIEPYQGAATGIGGIVRDILSMGARPIALMDPLRFGNPSNPRTKYLFEHVVSGIADYGNCIGVPTVGGDLFFDPSYNGNPLVNVMCIGLVSIKKMIRSAAKGPGNIILLIGSKTGRDGIHGATFASEELDEASEEKRPSVQVGDPFTEKLLIEACLELVENNLLVSLQDLGAAGLTSSASEMSTKGNVGIDIDISKVPRREEGLEPFEVMLSESQERMLAVVKPKNVDRAINICKKWELEATPIGKVTTTQKIRVYEEKNLIGEVNAKHLTEKAPTYKPPSQKPEYIDDTQAKISLEKEESKQVIQKLLESPHITSKKWIYEQYDHMVQVNTVITPGSDAAVIRIKDTSKAIAISVDGNPRYVYLNPYIGGKLAVAEAFRNIAVTGARPIAVTDCLNFGNPEDPEIFYQFKQAVSGMADALKYFGVPVVSGNVSFYNESHGKSIFPTPIVGAVGLLTDISRLIPSYFTQESSIIFVLGETHHDFGGSELQLITEGKIYGAPPQINPEKEKSLHDLLYELAAEKILLSAHDISEGGIAAALIQCACESKIGFRVEPPENLNLTDFLFSESPSRAIVTVLPENVPILRSFCSKFKVPLTHIGQTGGNKLQFVDIINLDLGDFKNKYYSTIGELVGH